jgi:dienelactone hydrolase
MSNTTTLGNLNAFVSAIAAQQQPAWSFLNGEFSAVAQWREPARAALLALLRYQPPRVPLDAEVVHMQERGDVICEKVYFNSSPWSRVPALLVRPARQSQPAPALVALHDHGGFYTFGKEKLVEIENEPAELSEFKHTYYSGRSYATELARRGYVVIVTDAFYFGERRIDFSTIDAEMAARLQTRQSTLNETLSDYHTQCSAFEEVVARHLFAAGVTWPGISSHDDRSSVDYLVSRPEVDAGRIGCLGLSMGGHRTNYLAATDPRIKAAVTVGWMAHWQDMLPHHVRAHAWAQFVPGLAATFELSDVVSVGMPAALMVQQCAQDDLFSPAGMHHACEKISRIYAKAHMNERFACHFYDVPHQFNAAMQTDAFEWLDRWLRE